LPNNADADNRVVINDGITRTAIAAFVIVNGVKGIGLLSQGPVSDPASYPVFVPADWEAAAVTIRLRRTAAGDAELVEVNGVAPSPRALLSATKLAGPTRAFATVELGCASPEAKCTVEYSAFRSERVANPVAGQLSLTSFRLQDSVDRVRFRADYALVCEAREKVGKTSALVRSIKGGGAQARARAGNVKRLISWAASAVCFSGAHAVEHC
jgi:hypothetical protein